jgi:alpha-N-acetylglucosaminidase
LSLHTYCIPVTYFSDFLTLPFLTALLTEKKINVARLNETHALYVRLLLDLDSLLATDPAFMLGPWLDQARNLGGDAVDCVATIVGDFPNCRDFMEWNARAQITTWHPVAAWHETVERGIGIGPNDYARKQWSGLVKDYYAARVDAYFAQANADAAAGKPFNPQAMDKRQAELAYAWQNDVGPNKYPAVGRGDPVEISKSLREKYGVWFRSC